MRVANSATALRTLVRALPEDRLRELVVEMLIADLTPAPAARRTAPPAKAKTPAQPAASTAATPARGKVGWPKGRLRGPRKSSAALAATRRAKHERDSERRRMKRAAAKGEGAPPVEAAKAGDTHKPNGKGGNGSSPDAKAQAAALWRHAELLSPSAAWRALERSTGLNAAVVLDAFRTRSLPPGIDAAAIERFLAQPAN